MRDERLQKIDRIFQAALDCKPEEREAFLEQVCAGDKGLRREVAGLLAADAMAHSFIETPPVEMAAALRAEIEPEPLAGKSISHYRILSLLGRGGMGEVYIAEDTALERKVAIKVLSAEIPEGARRLRREAQAAAALDHPNIAAIYEVGEEQGRSFIVMQYVKGETLAARMSKERLKIEEALSYAVQVADAMVEAHARGIIHRDIKPANIIIDARQQVKVLDFGLARRMRPPASVNDKAESDGSLSLPNLIAGTPAYMSPEQARGEELDARTDLFSFGVMLYEMISGAHPFEKGNSAETAAAIQLLEPLPLSDRSPQIPPELEKVVGRALAKARAERYQTASDLLEDLRRIRDHIYARPESARQNRAVIRPVRWRGWVAAFVASLIIGVVGLGIFLLRPTVPAPKVLKRTWLTKDGYYKDALVTDGARLYYRSLSSGTAATYQIGLAGGDPVPAPIDPKISSPLITNISTSRSEALAMDSASGDGALWIVSLPGGSMRRLGDLQGKGPFWFPDGRQIVYCNGNDVYLTNPEGAYSRKIASAPSDARYSTLAPDGRRLRFTVGNYWDYLRHIWEVNVDGTNLHEFLPGWNPRDNVANGSWT